MLKTFSAFTLILLQVYHVSGHGRMMDPPSRNAMWRYGYPNPVNYNDNELYCGGFSVHWLQNKGKCGVCGDPHNGLRLHETGGPYANELLGAVYLPGQLIDVDIELSANHQGYFELELCPSNKESQECFEKYPLNLEGKSTNRFNIPIGSPKKVAFSYRVKLPDGVTCTQCVIRWTYFARNTWGICQNGTQSVGCGNQETFVNCADVSITTNTGGFGPNGQIPVVRSPMNGVKTFKEEESYIKKHTTDGPLIVRSQVCIAKDQSNNTVITDGWCMSNCLKYPPNCPEDKCQCLNDCIATGDKADIEGTDVYCHINCLRFPMKERCPDWCKCT